MNHTIPTGLVLAALCAPALSQKHTHGSMVGSLQPTSVVVWTRASVAAKVSVLLNNSPNTTGATETTPILVASTTDFTAHIPMTGLKSGTKYYYATRVANPSTPTTNELGPWGTFKTPPASGANKVSFMASGDVFNKPQYGIFDKMALHAADFYVSMGDNVYSDTMTSQSEYWRRMKETRDHTSWKNFIQKFPVEAIWDDHEVFNDWDKTTPANIVGWGKKAFFDYFPMPNGTTHVYRTIKWGSSLEIFLLDLRQFRDANNAASLPTKTMLGATQKTWLKNSLMASTATFKVICSSVPVRWGKEGIDDWSGFVFEREELLQFINAKKIRNVSILSADSHVISVHHYREGVHEFQCGPLAAVVRPQIPDDPEVRFRASTLNFLQVSVDPTVTPATITFAYFDPNDTKLYSEVIKDETPSRANIFTDIPDGAFQMNGPHYYHNRGDVAVPVLHAGTYKISFDPAPGEVYTPTDLDLTVPKNADVVVAGRWREVPGPKVLMSDTFDGALSGYTVLDETGATNGPSAWLTSGGELLQASKIGGPVGGTDSDRPGTLLTKGDATWTDYTTIARMKSNDHGRMGVIFRYKDKDNYYRFFMDEGRPVYRLEKKKNGSFTTLAETLLRYVPHNYYDIRCTAKGSALKVFVNDEPLFSVTDSTFSKGKVGLYTWQNRMTRIEDLSVTEGEDYKPPANSVFTDYFDDNKIAGWKIEDHATQTGASAWVENLGVMFQLANIGDLNIAKPLSNPGTVCLATAAVPADVQFTIDMLNYDNDAMGLVFRYKNAANHYRFRWDRELRERRIEKVVAGKWSVLWSDKRDFNIAQWYRVRILSIGSRHRLYIAGELVADIRDTSHATGTVGMYSWRSAPVVFDRCLIQKPNKKLPVFVAVTKNRVTKIHGRAPYGGNEVYGVCMALTRTPAVPLAWLNPADPRVIDLAPDRLFLESLRFSPLWSGFAGKMDPQGSMTATINWPVFPSLKGTTIYVAGWTGDISKTPIKDVFPTLQVIFP